MDAPRSLSRGLQALEICHRHRDGVSFSLVARQLAISDSVCSRMLGGLVDLGFLQRNAEGLYVAGSRWLALLSPEDGDLDDHLRRLARPRLEYLREYSGNTVLLARNHGDHIVVLERLVHDDSMALQTPGVANPNFRGPPWGWLFASLQHVLSQAPNDDGPEDEEVRRAMAQLPETGWVIREQADRRRMAAPIVDDQGEVLAALVVGGTPISFSQEKTSLIGEQLVRLAREISEGLSVRGGRR